MFSINKYKFLRLLPDNEHSHLQAPPALEPCLFQTYKLRILPVDQG